MNCKYLRQKFSFVNINNENLIEASNTPWYNISRNHFINATYIGIKNEKQQVFTGIHAKLALTWTTSGEEERRTTQRLGEPLKASEKSWGTIRELRQSK